MDPCICVGFSVRTLLGIARHSDSVTRTKQETRLTSCGPMSATTQPQLALNRQCSVYVSMRGSRVHSFSVFHNADSSTKIQTQT